MKIAVTLYSHVWCITFHFISTQNF